VLLTLQNFSFQAGQLQDLSAGNAGSSIFVACVVVAFVCINLSLSRTVQLNERRTWLRHLLYKREQQDISAILFDLVPPYYVELLIKSSGTGTTLPVLQCRVVGLQFDIVAFTQLSQTVSPLQLAKTVNALFSEFDRAVLGRGLFKIDTIGDAYIIVGWLDDASVLPQEDEPAASAQTLGAEQHTILGRNIETCVDLLAVTEAMMRAVAKIREATGVALNARIGISMGTVVAGMQGELQPRFAVRGPAMKRMAMLETAAEVGKVHASADYMKWVSSYASGRASLARWNVASVRLLGDEGETFMLSTKNMKASRRATVFQKRPSFIGALGTTLLYGSFASASPASSLLDLDGEGNERLVVGGPRRESEGGDQDSEGSGPPPGPLRRESIGNEVGNDEQTSATMGLRPHSEKLELV
jgi:class 3 adenylate cyclase